MPKEHVRGLEDHPSSEGEWLEPWRFEVGWDKHGGGVRVATTDPEAPIGSLESGLWITVDRDRINEMIRLLRRARDQGFGKDE